MLFSRGVCCLAAMLAAQTFSSDVFGATRKEETVFDKGEKDDLEKGNVYKPAKKEDEKKAAKKKEEKLAKAVGVHIKNLKDKDPEVRQTSAEMLGILAPPLAVPELIDVLRPERQEPVGVLLSAHGALVRITKQNFGYKNHPEWNSWWIKNKDEFLKKAETEVDENTKLRAMTANTEGLMLLGQGEFRAAQQQFLMALDADPSVPDYKNNLGLAVMNQGRYLDAMVYFEETIGMSPDLPQPYMNMGRCYSAMNKSIEAQSWYKKAMERDKDGKIWDNFWMVGKEYLKRGEFRMAYEFLDQARVKAEKRRVFNVQLYNDLAIVHFGLDEYHSAWKELMNVKRLGYDPNPGFESKIRKQLEEMGIDPDAEDKEAMNFANGVTQPGATVNAKPVKVR